MGTVNATIVKTQTEIHNVQSPVFVERKVDAPYDAPFYTQKIVEDALAILLDSMDIILDILTTMASVKLSPRLPPPFFMEDMDTLDMLDTTDTPMLTMDLLTMESALLMLSLRLTPTFCMEDMDTLDTPDTMDTLIAPIATTVKLFPLVLWTANHPCFLYQ